MELLIARQQQYINTSRCMCRRKRCSTSSAAPSPARGSAKDAFALRSRTGSTLRCWSSCCLGLRNRSWLLARAGNYPNTARVRNGSAGASGISSSASSPPSEPSAALASSTANSSSLKPVVPRSMSASWSFGQLVGRQTGSLPGFAEMVENDNRHRFQAEFERSTMPSFTRDDMAFGVHQRVSLPIC